MVEGLTVTNAVISTTISLLRGTHMFTVTLTNGNTILDRWEHSDIWPRVGECLMVQGKLYQTCDVVCVGHFLYVDLVPFYTF